jgi:hypothetical protein
MAVLNTYKLERVHPTLKGLCESFMKDSGTLYIIFGRISGSEEAMLKLRGEKVPTESRCDPALAVWLALERDGAPRFDSQAYLNEILQRRASKLGVNLEWDGDKIWYLRG